MTSYPTVRKVKLRELRKSLDDDLFHSGESIERDSVDGFLGVLGARSRHAAGER